LDVDIFDANGYFYINDGKGNFEVFKSGLNIYGRYTVEIFDLNNDGYNEIIFTGHAWDTPTTIYLGNENHTYSEDNKIELEPFDEIWGVVVDILVDDLNSDGNYEIILSTTKGPDNFYQGSLIQIISLDKDLNLMSSTIANNDDERRWVMWLRVADYDNDGDKDILSDDKGNFGNPLILLNDGKVNFQENIFCIAPTIGVYHTEYSDINNDGFADTVTSGHTWDTPTTITFGSKQNITLKDNCREELSVVDGFETTSSMALGDMDRDGALDIVLAQTQRDVENGGPKYEGYALVIYYLTKEGKYKSFEKVVENLDTTDYMYSISLEDLNEDGQPDIRARVGDEDMSFINGVDFNP